MNAALVLALAFAAAAGPGEPAGVVGLARGSVELTRSSSSAGWARAGSMVHSGDVVETTPAGWAELHLLPATRVKLSAGTRVQVIGPREVRVEVGRVWVQLPDAGGAPFVLGAPRVVAELRGGASLVVDASASLGVQVAARRGITRLTADGAPNVVAVRPGQVVVVRPSAQGRLQAARGGGALGDLVAMESRAATEDVEGLKAFLLGRARAAVPAPAGARGVSDLGRLAPEVSGGDTPPIGALVEGALRPTPFFESEVPPKGPNVAVEVSFGGD